MEQALEKLQIEQAATKRKALRSSMKESGAKLHGNIIFRHNYVS